MSRHEPRRVQHAQSGQHRTHCLGCGESSDWTEHKWQADDWWTKHLEKIERIKAHLGGRTPTMESQLRYYRSKEAEGGEHRAQWKQLADELNHRLHPMDKWVEVHLPGLEP